MSGTGGKSVSDQSIVIRSTADFNLPHNIAMVLLVAVVRCCAFVFYMIFQIGSAEARSKNINCPKRVCQEASNPFDIVRNDAVSGLKNSDSYKTNPGDMFRDISNNPNTKKISEVYDNGFYTSLCWIEITTITETRNGSKSATREYAITFETPSDIPQKYVRKKSDPINGEAVQYKIFDRDTKKSEVVNFTTVSKSEDAIVRQNRKVLCGSGPIYTKEFIQWPHSERKRVEIRVSPKQQNLVATDCTALNGTLKNIPDLSPTRREFDGDLDIRLTAGGSEEAEEDILRKPTSDAITTTTFKVTESVSTDYKDTEIQENEQTAQHVEDLVTTSEETTSTVKTLLGGTTTKAAGQKQELHTKNILHSTKLPKYDFNSTYKPTSKLQTATTPPKSPTKIIKNKEPRNENLGLNGTLANISTLSPTSKDFDGKLDTPFTKEGSEEGVKDILQKQTSDTITTTTLMITKGVSADYYDKEIKENEQTEQYLEGLVTTSQETTGQKQELHTKHILHSTKPTLKLHITTTPPTFLPEVIKNEEPRNEDYKHLGTTGTPRKFIIGNLARQSTPEKFVTSSVLNLSNATLARIDTEGRTSMKTIVFKTTTVDSQTHVINSTKLVPSTDATSLVDFSGTHKVPYATESLKDVEITVKPDKPLKYDVAYEIGSTTNSAKTKDLDDFKVNNVQSTTGLNTGTTQHEYQFTERSFSTDWKHSSEHDAITTEPYNEELFSEKQFKLTSVVTPKVTEITSSLLQNTKLKNNIYATPNHMITSNTKHNLETVSSKPTTERNLPEKKITKIPSIIATDNYDVSYTATGLNIVLNKTRKLFTTLPKKPVTKHSDTSLFTTDGSILSELPENYNLRTTEEPIMNTDEVSSTNAEIKSNTLKTDTTFNTINTDKTLNPGKISLQKSVTEPVQQNYSNVLDKNLTSVSTNTIDNDGVTETIPKNNNIERKEQVSTTNIESVSEISLSEFVSSDVSSSSTTHSTLADAFSQSSLNNTSVGSVSASEISSNKNLDEVGSTKVSPYSFHSPIGHVNDKSKNLLEPKSTSEYVITLKPSQIEEVSSQLPHKYYTGDVTVSDGLSDQNLKNTLKTTEPVTTSAPFSETPFPVVYGVASDNIITLKDLPKQSERTSSHIPFNSKHTTPGLSSAPDLDSFTELENFLTVTTNKNLETSTYANIQISSNSISSDLITPESRIDYPESINKQNKNFADAYTTTSVIDVEKLLDTSQNTAENKEDSLDEMKTTKNNLKTISSSSKPISSDFTTRPNLSKDVFLQPELNTNSPDVYFNPSVTPSPHSLQNKFSNGDKYSNSLLNGTITTLKDLGNPTHPITQIFSTSIYSGITNSESIGNQFIATTEHYFTRPGQNKDYVYISSNSTPSSTRNTHLDERTESLLNDSPNTKESLEQLTYSKTNPNIYFSDDDPIRNVTSSESLLNNFQSSKNPFIHLSNIISTGETTSPNSVLDNSKSTDGPFELSSDIFTTLDYDNFSSENLLHQNTTKGTKPLEETDSDLLSEHSSDALLPRGSTMSDSLFDKYQTATKPTKITPNTYSELPVKHFDDTSFVVNNTSTKIILDLSPSTTERIKLQKIYSRSPLEQTSTEDFTSFEGLLLDQFQSTTSQTKPDQEVYSRVPFKIDDTFSTRRFTSSDQFQSTTKGDLKLEQQYPSNAYSASDSTTLDRLLDYPQTTVKDLDIKKSRYTATMFPFEYTYDAKKFTDTADEIQNFTKNDEVTNSIPFEDHSVRTSTEITTDKITDVVKKLNNPLCNIIKQKVSVRVKILMDHILEKNESGIINQEVIPIMGVEKQTEFDIKPKIELPVVPYEKLSNDWNKFLDDLANNFFYFHKNAVQDYTELKLKKLNVAIPGHDFSDSILTPRETVQRMQRIRNSISRCHNEGGNKTVIKLPVSTLIKKVTPFLNKHAVENMNNENLLEKFEQTTKSQKDLSTNFYRFLLDPSSENEKKEKDIDPLKVEIPTKLILPINQQSKIKEIQGFNNWGNKPNIMFRKIKYIPPGRYRTGYEPFSVSDLFPNFSKNLPAQNIPKMRYSIPPNVPPELFQPVSSLRNYQNYGFLPLLPPTSNNPYISLDIAPIKQYKQSINKDFHYVIPSIINDQDDSERNTVEIFRQRFNTKNDGADKLQMEQIDPNTGMRYVNASSALFKMLNHVTKRSEYVPEQPSKKIIINNNSNDPGPQNNDHIRFDAPSENLGSEYLSHRLFDVKIILNGVINKLNTVLDKLFNR